MRKNCPLCDGWNPPIKKTVFKRNGRISLELILNVAKCGICNFGYQAPELDEALLGKIYKNDYVGNMGEQRKRFFRNRIFRRSSALSFGRYIRDHNDFSLLEIGCSSGYNLKNISNKYPNIIVEGVDLDEESIKYGRRKGLSISNDNAFDSKERYDVVFLNHVFEHIVNMDDFLSLLKNKVKKNGIICINVPNSIKWKESVSWEHVNYFSEESFNKLLLKNDFTNFEISTNLINKKYHYVPEIRVVIHFGDSRIIKTDAKDLWCYKDDRYIIRTRARDQYDSATNKVDRKIYSEIYKKNKKGRTFKQLFIGSKLYVFFSGKFFNKDS